MRTTFILFLLFSEYQSYLKQLFTSLYCHGHFKIKGMKGGSKKRPFDTSKERECKATKMSILKKNVCIKYATFLADRCGMAMRKNTKFNDGILNPPLGIQYIRHQFTVKTLLTSFERPYYISVILFKCDMDSCIIVLKLLF